MVQPSPFTHRPVMLDDIIELFASVPAGVVIDATLGGAGHSFALLEKYPQISLLGLDQDPVAVEAATKRLAPFGERAKIVSVRFDQMQSAVAQAFPGMPVVGVLFDLGVSSPQLDVAERGFSYRNGGPLDMRMDTRQELSADTVVNTYELDELLRVLNDGGEDRFAMRIARAIIAARPLQATDVLADVVRNAIPAPARRKGGDPAKRTFQAIRLEVNDELPTLERALDAAIEVVSVGGRVVSLAYHSGEDRLVKGRFINASTGGCICPPGFPCVCGAVPTARLIKLKKGKQGLAIVETKSGGAIKPSAEEVEANPRSESARLRAIEIVAKPLGDSQ